MKTTDFICTAAVVAIAAYDVVAIYRGGVDASVSRWMQGMGQKSPFLLLAIGFLLGHWFGPLAPKAVEGGKQVIRMMRGK